MSDFEGLLTEVQEAPVGPTIGALFDFDGTVIAGYSANDFVRERFPGLRFSGRDVTGALSVTSGFLRGKTSFDSLMLQWAGMLEGSSEKDYREFGERVYERRISAKVYPEVRELIRAHFQKGHTVAIVSSALIYQIQPAARDLDVTIIRSTRLAVQDGKFTGQLDGAPCYAEGKCDAARALAAEYGLDLSQSYFYTDGAEDISLLNLVGHPRPLNPDRKLTEFAQQWGWPVQHFNSRGRASLTQRLRSGGINAALLVSGAAGLPIWALTGSTKEAMNFSQNLYVDTASALIGLKLKVSGEHHLWTHRPAVFLINHQSVAEMFIVGRLLKGDIASVGKSEIRNVPFMGKLMEQAGMILIDRKNAVSAIEAMQPLIDALRHQGKSVLIAPEGTRSISTKLGKFKKGPFHIAMQAGVPIVPIVIHNAIDVIHKHGKVYRPATVRVDVLAPVDTSSWQADTIDDHIASVRALFLETLGQVEARTASGVSVAATGDAVASDSKPARKASARRKASAKND